ncbi:hypothetical protein LRH25_03120 [Ideonella azotifigens]|uniref:Uncharacterized protein n=1 Tax=Ideonella azotifigens TaxID=513160 RepID=A0ABP3VU05_9BURK|nr:hypothetical protein [Ideonella azotifigens]MCD2339326.1 hypothetical protein [Ideonella azotifigens]
MAFIILVSACSPDTRPDANTFTFATGVHLLSFKERKPDANTGRGVSVTAESDHLRIKVRDFFYRNGDFPAPWIGLPHNGIVTLNIGTHEASSPLSTKDEYALDLEVQVELRRLQDATSLAIYNLDTGDVLAHVALPVKSP